MSLSRPSLPLAVQQLTDELLNRLPPSLRNSRLFAASLAGLSLLGISQVLSILVADYRKWYRLGTGRLPRNPIGYIFVQILRPLALETRSIAPYARLRETSKLENSSFLTSPGLSNDDTALDLAAVLPTRPGPRPTIGRHMFPSRQEDMLATRALKDKLIGAVQQLAKDDPATLTTGTSLIECQGQALFLREELMEWAIHHDRARGGEREVVHVHELDGGMHLFLSARDSEIVLTQKWGERHPLSGRRLLGRGIGPGFIMVYAPRDEKEIDIVMKIVRASIRYAAEGRTTV